jgi:hypothetical protein
MTYATLAIEVQHNTKNGTYRLACRFCEMIWPRDDAKEAHEHLRVFHPDSTYCGHKAFANGHCAELGCKNYYGRYWMQETE